MLGEPEYNMNELFAQLGLERMFLQEEWQNDAAWVETIDELNVRMHPDA